MISEIVLEIVGTLINDKISRRNAILLTVFAVVIGLLIGFIPAFILYVSFILGHVVAWFLIKYPDKIAQIMQSFYHNHTSSTARKTLKHSCSICNDLSCQRYNQTTSNTPWKHLHIGKDLNEALEQFYDKLIESFVLSWYGEFTKDMEFINELRYCFRFATATIINRILELDIADVITSQLFPRAVKHIDDYIYIQQIAELKNAEINDITIEYLGNRLHVAASNRKNELAYLRHLASALLRHILPKAYIQSSIFSVLIREILAGWVFLPLMDVMADPNVINSLVILVLTNESRNTSRTEETNETVEFLENYGIVNTKVSSFATNLNKIKNDTHLLYALMQFLKKQEQVNLLQFCLDVDEFNIKFLTPEISQKQQENLYSEAEKLYKDYLDKYSNNFIGCPVVISDEFDLMPKENSNVDNLKILSKILYKAYDYTFNELENNLLPQFFHSSEFYECLCGPNVEPNSNSPKASSSTVRNYGSPLKDRTKKYDSYGQGAIAKISNSLVKIKSILKTNQPVEGAFFSSEAQKVEDSTVEDISLEESKAVLRDLSTWNVSIPSCQASPLNKVIYFCVKVERSDVLSENIKKNWAVLRKDQDFYTLKAKLVEFHGETEICDCPLPSRKAGSSIDTRMKRYEVFIKRLLQKPILKGSDLLHSFLTTEEDFSVFVTTNASSLQDIGNIYQTVANKFRKQKGQHLDSFMKTFLNSTGVNLNKKNVWTTEVAEECDSTSSGSIENESFPKAYKNHIFNDNFGVDFTSLKETMSGSTNPQRLIECVFYLLKHVFKLRNGFLRLYVSICSIAEQAIDLICHRIIERKLNSSLCQPNLAYLVRYLQDAIFNPQPSPTEEELDKRKQRAFTELENVVPFLATKIFGDGVQDGFKTILTMLQNPHYNKQIAYNFLDIILTQIYPSLEECDENS